MAQHKVTLPSFNIICLGIILFCSICPLWTSATVFAEVKAKIDVASPGDKDALKAKIVSLSERYDRGDDTYRVLAEFKSMGAAAVTALLDGACVGERSLKKDSRLVTILSQPALNRITFNKLYPIFLADQKQLCWTNAQLLLVTAKGTGHEVDIGLKLLEHPETFIRYNVLDYLKSMQPQSLPVMDAIIGALADRQNCIRKHASAIIKQIGRQSVPELLNAVNHHDPSVRRRAIETLEKLGADAQDAVPVITRVFSTDDSVMVRTQIIRSLPKMGAQKEFIIQLLTEALADKDPEVREWAARAVGDFKEGALSVASSLSRASDDKDEEVRKSAQFAIKRIGPALPINFIRMYYVYPLLIILLCLVYYLFFRRNNHKIESLRYFLPACFGHPSYLAAGLYVAGEAGFSRYHAGAGHVDFFGYTAILFAIFFIRFTFFLYSAWVKTRAPLSVIHPYAFDKFVRIHSYCAWGIPLYLLIIFASEYLLYYLLGWFFPALIIIFILAFLQSVHAIVAAMSPEKWILSAFVMPQDDLHPLSPEERRKRKFAGVFVWGLGIMIVGLLVAPQLTETKRLSHQTIYDNRMVAREADKEPNSARYHFLLGQSYERNERMDQGERLRKAVDEYSKAIELDPKLAGAYRHRAESYRLLKDYRLAIDDFNKCEALSDEIDTEIYRRRAMAYGHLGMRDRMCEDYRNSYCGNYYNKNYIGLVERGLCK